MKMPGSSEECAAQPDVEARPITGGGTRMMPLLLTVEDTAHVLRTTRGAVYAMIARGQLPGVVRIGRRVVVRADLLLHWLNQKSASSLRSAQR